MRHGRKPHAAGNAVVTQIRQQILGPLQIVRQATPLAQPAIAADRAGAKLLNERETGLPVAASASKQAEVYGSLGLNEFSIVSPRSSTARFKFPI